VSINFYPHKKIILAGIYIHIPFCRQKCHYCNFYSLASLKYADSFIDALLQEIALRKAYLSDEEIHTIYLGGGTPSLLSADSLNRIADVIHAHYLVHPDAEITLEANPDDISKDYLHQLRHTFINRLSIGIQSFFDEDLVYLHRVHTSSQAHQAIQLAKEAGFDKLTIDLIYGIPGLTDEKWEANIAAFLDMDIHHLSAYALTVEPHTALAHLISKGTMQAVDEQQSANQFELLMQRMEAAGFIHYEISNFARPGHYSRHNSLYWTAGNYLGLGPSAHSFNGYSRQWNVSNLKQYIEQIGQVESITEKEILTIEQRYDEYVMTSLRTSWGCDLEHIQNAFGTTYSDYCNKQAEKYIQSGHLTKLQNRYFLTFKGKLFADGIASELFMV